MLGWYLRSALPSAPSPYPQGVLSLASQTGGSSGTEVGSTLPDAALAF